MILLVVIKEYFVFDYKQYKHVQVQVQGFVSPINYLIIVHN